jgi:hypothetical protein
MTESTITAKCSHCGESLPPNHNGPCPKCGEEGKAINIIVGENINVSESVSFESVREFYEQNPMAKWAVILITILSSLVGLFLNGLVGVLVGLALGVFSYFIGPKAVTKVREIRRS